MAQDPVEGRPFRWGDLRKRIISAAFLAPLALVAIWMGAGMWAGVIALVTVGLACEWVQLCGFQLGAMPGLSVPLAIVTAGAVALAEHEGAALILLLAGFGVAWTLGRLLRREDSGARLRSPASLAAGVLYVGLPCIAMLWLRQDGGAGRPNVLFLVLIVWASDVGAYLAGRLVGGPRLAPRISPGKTWSGAVGGLASAVGMGCFIAFWAAGGGNLWRISLVAACLGAIAQAGDLLESLIKRRFGVKDSSRLIPGHGGLLDRLDGVLTAAPAAALLALALGRGVELWQ